MIKQFRSSWKLSSSSVVVGCVRVGLIFFVVCLPIIGHFFSDSELSLGVEISRSRFLSLKKVRNTKKMWHQGQTRSHSLCLSKNLDEKNACFLRLDLFLPNISKKTIPNLIPIPVPGFLPSVIGYFRISFLGTRDSRTV